MVGMLVLFFSVKIEKMDVIRGFIITFVPPNKEEPMSTLSVITSPIGDEWACFERRFAAVLESDNPLLRQVLVHIGKRGGKRMRPLLLLLMAKQLGGVTEASYQSAVALELLHTASLVHDDVVDESDERRWQASLNALVNNKVSVLVGEYVLGSCLVLAGQTADCRIVEAVARLGQDLADGEILQLANVATTAVDEQAYYEVIRKKTASLFATCAEVAAYSVDAPREVVEKARRFGESIGMCFQIKDDLLDYGLGDRIGKPVGNDMREGKLTLPALYVLNRTTDAQALGWANKVKDGVASPEEITALTEFVKAHGGIEYARSKMQDFRQIALELLDEMGGEKAVKEALAAYVAYAADRLM